MLITKEVDSMEAMVNVAELLYQLQYGTVVLERLPDTGQKSRTAEANTLKIDDSEKNDEFFFKEPGKKFSSSTSKPYCLNCDKTIENVSLKNAKTCPNCRTGLRYKCMMCNNPFPNLKTLNYHLVSKCNAKGIYRCCKCDYFTTIKQSMARHALVHSINKATGIRKCLGCAEKFVRFINLKSHLKKCSKALNFQPFNAENSSGKVKDNVTISANTDSIRKCSGCGKEFHHSVNLKKHQKVCKKTLDFKRLSAKDSNPNSEDNNATSVKAKSRHQFSRRCSNCDVAIGVKSLINNANCQKCGSSDTFQCNKCNKIYSRYNSIRYHLDNVCFPSKRYSLHASKHKSDNQRNEKKCPNCKKRFIKGSKSLQHHLKYCAKEPNIFCRLCDYSTKYMHNLRKHLTTHENCTDPIVETILKNIYDKVPNAENKEFDTAQSAPNLNSDSLDFIKRYCSKCEERTDVNSDKRKNCQKCRTLLLLECVLCKRIYERLDKILYHVQNSHSVETRDPKDTNVQINSKKRNSTVTNCTQCGRFVKIGHMENHLQFCGKKSNLRCKYCPYNASSMSKLKFHLRQTHFPNKKTIIAKARAKRTKKGVLDWLTSTRRYCPKCDKIFMIKKQTKIAMCQKCDTPLLYQCCKCHGRFDNYSKISYHLKTFCFPPSLYSCTKCDYTTFKKLEIENHMKKIHKSEIIACFKCGREFKCKKYLRAHEECCGTKKSLCCDYCSFKTKRRKYLRTHLRHYHLNLITSSKNESVNITAKKEKP